MVYYAVKKESEAVVAITTRYFITSEQNMLTFMRAVANMLQTPLSDLLSCPFLYRSLVMKEH